MTRPRSSSLSPAEWKVMEIVWDLGECAARDVYHQAGELHGMGASTVKTLLRRLVEKGHLTTTQVGNCFVYKPVRTRLSTLCAAADSLLERVDRGAGRVLAHMLKRSIMSKDEIAELRGILDQHSATDEDQEDER